MWHTWGKEHRCLRLANVSVINRGESMPPLHTEGMDNLAFLASDHESLGFKPQNNNKHIANQTWNIYLMV